MRSLAAADALTLLALQPLSTMAQKTKQEANSTSTEQRITQLQNEVQQLRVILDEQSDQLAKQQKLMQLIQFSWLTFFFVVFNLVLLGLFVGIFMKDRGQCRLRIL